MPGPNDTEKPKEPNTKALKDPKLEPKLETGPDAPLTFDQFLAQHATTGLVKEHSGFFFTTSKNAPKFNGKSLFLDVHSLQLLQIISRYYTADGGRNLLRMLEARGRKRSGRRKRKHTEGATHISLRTIDYFFTNYSKVCHVIIGNRQPMQEYDRKLSYHTKQRFDMFSRHRLVYFRHPTTNMWTATSVRQLNFFQFYLESGVYEFIEKILPELHSHMSNTMRQARRARQVRKNRKALGNAPVEKRRVPLIAFNAKKFGVLTEAAHTVHSDK